MTLTITKRDGSKAPFNADRINKSIERACYGLRDPISKVIQIATETRLTLYDGITTEELDAATINAALQNTHLGLDFDKIATRLLLKDIYKKVLGDYDHEESHEITAEEFSKLHRDQFRQYILNAVELGLLDSRMVTSFNLEELADNLKIENDELYKYSGLSTMQNRYLIKHENGWPMETPQYFWMRIAMGMSLNEKNQTEWAKKFYDKMSRLEYLSAGSSNIGAGTPNPKLSNCFLMEMHDDMEHIGKTVSDVLLLSKATGGIGLSVTKLRAEGSLLKSSNSKSSGPIPFMHIVDSAVRAVQRGGKKKGALCFYIENWHLNFQDFLDLKQNNGDDYRRTRTANTAVFISDEFMKRVLASEDWYLFDPNEVKDLNDLYGEAFSKRYNEYVEMAQAGKIKLFEVIPARVQYKNILISLETTSHPWLTWKDAINVRALNSNTGTIHCSNLCTEVTLPTDRDSVAVCNLISINLARHIREGQIDWHRLEESVRLAIRQLDNLIDINELPIPEARKADSENRAVGLGLMGFADTLELLGYSYEDNEAYDLTDQVFEFISYMSIDESTELAKERGVYKNFKGSGWSEGRVPVDTLQKLEHDRDRELTVKKESAKLIPALDWETLRSKVKRGMRNATLLAIAPNANIGLVAGTSPGIDPRFTQMFSRNKISGKYLEVNANLVRTLEKDNLWEKTREAILENHGDIEGIAEIPEHIKRIYKTSFSVSPYAYVEVAARAQKWVDMAISRNMYLDVRDIDEIMNIYTTAWDKGLKTTYYLHMKPRHTAEQSTTVVNKREALGKKGFAVLFEKKEELATPVPEEVKIEVPIPSPIEVPTERVEVAKNNPKNNIEIPEDPNEKFLCESCQ
ncbi:ribonucleoside-diphosphate reductase subunit alpha [Candidatus Nomurabacteria bacterium RIFCSPLOWO2_01_FULL_46_18]|uniref:Ribonucleoside-diphosphate reductase n=1 Tax=Candidatus Nomurabacteria bacterium RIFCSPLOWO2_01_FULL_46_18 TaxID=1801783 RepID=A0A1F6XBW4_9BACT|nr:MAG: ribonucleoside-diphosphate reductase subunit alpha [Candidatus Nomurabacteria bacterium RIFCSPLOWO2_01_FULL_46_18]